jgi:SAM-dependent methyltransferase
VVGVRAGEAVAWHDVECGSYAADLPLWRELAQAHGRQGVLDLGAGTGRVALDLASRGHAVAAVEQEAALCHELGRRAARLGVELEIVHGDARSLDLGRRFGLVLAPMQLAHLMGGRDGRLKLLRSVGAALEPGGIAALALSAPTPPLPDDAPPPLPDVREADGWVFSSAPTDIRDTPAGAEIVRLRQAVSPAGEIRESESVVLLESCSPGGLEEEAAEAGLAAAGRRSIPETLEHVGSTVVLLEPAR